MKEFTRRENFSTFQSRIETLVNPVVRQIFVISFKIFDIDWYQRYIKRLLKVSTVI